MGAAGAAQDAGQQPLQPCPGWWGTVHGPERWEAQPFLLVINESPGSEVVAGSPPPPLPASSPCDPHPGPVPAVGVGPLVTMSGTRLDL